MFMPFYIVIIVVVIIIKFHKFNESMTVVEERIALAIINFHNIIKMQLFHFSSLTSGFIFSRYHFC